MSGLIEVVCRRCGAKDEMPYTWVSGWFRTKPCKWRCGGTMAPLAAPTPAQEPAE